MKHSTLIQKLIIAYSLEIDELNILASSIFFFVCGAVFQSDFT